MKKMISLFAVIMLLVAVPAFAGPLQSSTDTAIANPFATNSGTPLGNPNSGGWGYTSQGVIQVDSFAQGTKSAQTTSYANGTAFGNGFSAGIQTSHFGLGAAGSIAGVCLDGAGYGLGIDKLSFSNNPDYASVGINYAGEVVRGAGVGLTNGAGTFAGGSNQTGATFTGGSFNDSYGKVFGVDILVPALAVGVDAAGALAGGLTTAGYVALPNFAASSAKTVGFSAYCADEGTVSGTGQVQHQAVVDNGSFGLSYGSAQFNYNSNNNIGYGMAETGGWTKINNGPNSSTVTSFSSSKAKIN
jgi:hypothetical protein